MRHSYLFGICCVLAVGCSRTNPDPGSSALRKSASTAASAELQPTQGNHAAGTLQLTAGKDGVRISGQMTGLTPGTEHGIHIHENGDCSAADAQSAGSHFSPMQHRHGPPRPDTHVGDLGNIQANADGVAQVDVEAMLATLGTGAPTDVRGKSVIVHAKKDDLSSQPAGDSGPRIACGVIS
jgi:Cu-Zn family superoxide dismutase